MKDRETALAADLLGVVLATWDSFGHRHTSPAAHRHVCRGIGVWFALIYYWLANNQWKEPAYEFQRVAKKRRPHWCFVNSTLHSVCAL